MSDPDDQPSNVKDLLAEAKDASELMVDLAYAAVFFNDEKLAEEVEDLQQRLYGYLRRLRQFAILAARSPEDAEQMGDVLWIAGAIEKIGDAASDIARVIAARLGIPDALRQDLRHADEIIGRVRVREDAPCIGRSLRDLLLPSETGMWLMAIRRGDQWVFDPDADTVLSEGDVLLFNGPEDGVNLIREIAGAPPLPEPPGGRPPGAHRARPGRRHPDRDEELLRGGRGARLLGAAVPAPRPGRGGRRAGGAVRHPARRAGVLGAEGRARRPATPTSCAGCSAWLRGRDDLRRGPRPDVADRAGREAPPGHPDGARGDRRGRRPRR